jgi:hypothetical protein
MFRNLFAWCAAVAFLGDAAAAQTKSAASFDACSLLTKQEAAAALAEPVADGKSGATGRSMMPNTAAYYCEYISPTSVHKVHLNVWRATPAGVAQLKQMGQIVCSSKTKDGLAGLGDTACWYNEKHGELQVFKGANFFSVEMSRKGDTTEAIKTVAKAAAARLP